MNAFAVFNVTLLSPLLVILSLSMSLVSLSVRIALPKSSATSALIPSLIKLWKLSVKPFTSIAFLVNSVKHNYLLLSPSWMITSFAGTVPSPFKLLLVMFVLKSLETFICWVLVRSSTISAQLVIPVVVPLLLLSESKTNSFASLALSVQISNHKDLILMLLLEVYQIQGVQLVVQILPGLPIVAVEGAEHLLEVLSQ